MTLIEHLGRWREMGAITAGEHDAIAAVVRKERFSVFTELTALLYLGVLSAVWGIGWTVQAHFARLGDAAILLALTAGVVASLTYCFVRGVPYSHQPRESSDFAFDYILYFGCLLFGVALGFIEFRFHLLKDSWDRYLLLSSMVYFALAYRFDNRLVLSLGLSTLAGWFGVRLYHLGWLRDSVRVYALGYAGTIALCGAGLHHAGIKRHFLGAYLHVAANVALGALTSGVFDRSVSGLYLAALVVVAGGSIGAGLQFRRFAFVIYGVVYAYVGVSIRLIRDITSDTATFSYFVASAIVVVAALVVLARRIGRTS